MSIQSGFGRLATCGDRHTAESHSISTRSVSGKSGAFKQHWAPTQVLGPGDGPRRLLARPRKSARRASETVRSQRRMTQERDFATSSTAHGELVTTSLQVRSFTYLSAHTRAVLARRRDRSEGGGSAGDPGRQGGIPRIGRIQRPAMLVNAAISKMTMMPWN